ncbi:phosphopantetheine-binding protein [Streptomyces sp. NPDC002886]|uniref:phosphopantetheine-binding protein n=1 Tax=Streptomyces sp. NPDC002886 TaxID=3364667 RepID=UPI0036A89B46
MWDAQFEEILRKHLPYLSPGQAIQESDDLRDLGLDSLGTVSLMADLEDGYKIRFVDDMMRMESFATPAVLWSGIASLTSA